VKVEGYLATAVFQKQDSPESYEEHEYDFRISVMNRTASSLFHEDAAFDSLSGFS